MLCTLDAESLDVPGAVLWVVGVLCGVAVACGVAEACPLDGAPFDVPGAVSCGVGVAGCAGWDVEPPRSA